ncbi:4Fe-4S binding protein [Crocosphaera sp. UHCC 0190]|uniref:4Fe-4S binding protein n=1 Tax=Crocosphaera sp. UHCC 0190 TaxID=3110246 RepID=UPI002B20D32D|nr:4Fe-4S binding protein [Crocosphaera sp. UHCC 0190]MEA5508206.1 4Fe-4S binding protein [Crocosphaera sp. UHCC 0190]
MSYTITDQCITCHRCHKACPTGAIKIQNNVLLIDPTLCNDCQGYYGTPQCASVCPTNSGCLPTYQVTGGLKNQVADYWDSWFNHYNNLVARLKGKQTNPYWEQWFDVYSQEILTLTTVSS